MNKKTYVDEAVACFYSRKNCHILIGGVDENQVLTIHTQIVEKPAILGKIIKLLSSYSLPVWINSHEILKRNLPHTISGELNFNQENGIELEELHDLYKSLIATQQLEYIEEPEGENAQSCLQILIKAIGRDLYTEQPDVSFSNVGEERDIYKLIEYY